ncbi:MAG: hypothetical protein V4585_21385 [Bacteroidota bacterium]
MNISSLKKTLTGLILFTVIANSQAQEIKSEPIFGSVLEKKISKDSTKKKSSFNLLKPAFLRLGVMGGGLISFDNSTGDNGGGTMGLRVEYGFTNRLSLVGEVQGNGIRSSTFTRNQASLGVNWMPFKSRRLQPYVGLGGGVGGNGFGNRRFGDNRPFGQFLDDDNNRERGVQGFAFARTGVNYVLAKKIIATAETSYQLPFNNASSNGGLALRVGLSYQFGKRRK